MNLAVIIVIILLIGARKQTPEGIPEPTPPNPTLRLERLHLMDLEEGSGTI